MGQTHSKPPLPISEFEPEGAGPDRPPRLGPPADPTSLGTLGGYDLREVIGSGGMGIVYRAEDVETGETVAIKLLRPELTRNHKAVRHFIRESEFQSRLEHPGIMPIIEICDDPESPWFVMPLISGGSVAELIAREGALDLESIQRIAGGVAQALDHSLRERGLLHRDVKPANVLLKDDGSPLVSDFGLARLIGSDSIHEFQPSHRLGTLAYMSPQVAAGEADMQCDVYAFGVMLGEMMTGEFAGQESHQRARALKGPWATIALGCACPGPEDRYSSMSMVLSEIERIESGKAPRGCPGDRRSGAKSVATIMAVLVVALVAILIIPRNGNVPAIDAQASRTTIESWGNPISHPDVSAWAPARIGGSASSAGTRIYTLNAHRDEMLVFHPNGSLVQRFPVREDGAAAANVNITGLTDVGGDTQREVILDWLEPANRRAVIQVFNPHGGPLKRIELKGGHSFEIAFDIYGPKLQYRKFLDLESDGDLEILTTINTGKELRPRGVYAFDYMSGETLWKFDTQSWAYSVRTLADLKTTELKVLVATAAVCNTNGRQGEPDDTRSRLHCLDHQGNSEWSIELGDEYVYPLFLDDELTADSLIYVIARGSPAVRAEYGKGAFGRVVAVGRDGVVVHEWRIGRYIESAYRQGDQILVADHMGFIHRLKSDLSQPEGPFKLFNDVPERERMVIEFVGAEDFDSDGKADLLLDVVQMDWEKRMKRHQLYLLDGDLNPIAFRELQIPQSGAPTHRVELANIDGDSRMEIVMFTETDVRFFSARRQQSR
ncbi:MAG: serine/threonine protein kinase [Limisphaerales bacterium]|jgi:serine/threonine protein kinase